MNPSVIIVGPLGSGRSSVGRELAELLGVALVETEDVVSVRFSKSFDQVVLSEDPDVVAMEINEAALDQVHGNALGGTPGGVVTLLPSAATTPVLAAIRDSQVPLAFLNAPVAELARRVGLNAPRAATMGQPRAMFAHMVRELEDTYSGLDREVFVTEGRSPHTVAIEIARHFALE